MPVLHVYEKAKATQALYARHVGAKAYELSDHLGNVTVTVSDLKRELPSTQLALYGLTAPLGTDEKAYAAQVLSYSNYYAFGMSMAGRSKQSAGYRYGFNGKENDTEWGTGLIQDYGFRLYNPAIAKFLSVDPLAQSYPWYTPYQFAGNKPIVFIDLDGLEEGLPWYLGPNKYGGKPILTLGAHNINIPNLQRQEYLPVAAVGAGANVIIAPYNVFVASWNMLAGGWNNGLAGQVNYAENSSKELEHFVRNINKKDLQNPELYENIAGTLLLGYLSKKLTKVSFVNKTSKKINIALGLRESQINKYQDILAPFAEKVDGLHNRQWLENGLYDKNLNNFEEAFHQAVKRALKTGGGIKFNLDEFDFEGARKTKGKSALEGGYTNWEFNTIIDTPSLLKNTQFYINGEMVPTNDILKKIDKN